MLNQILIFVAVLFFSYGIHVARSHDCECDCKSANETDNRVMYYLLFIINLMGFILSARVPKYKGTHNT